MSRSTRLFALALLNLGIAGSFAHAQDDPAAPAKSDDQPPAVGDVATDFTLPKLGGGEVNLEDLNAEGPVAVVVLRGWPGYQCPICSRQYASFYAKREDFAKAGANVVFIYPGPADGLDSHAEEFFANSDDLPENFVLATDPDYEFTDAYGLRWDAPKETAYPSTFVVGSDGKVLFSKISMTHGDRAEVADVLKAMPAKSKP